MRIPFLTAVQGGTVEIAIPRPGRHERMKVRIPSGIDDGGTMRLAGKGDAGSPPGDAYLTVRVEPHAVFRREDRNLVCEVSVGIATAALGGKVEVDTLDQLRKALDAGVDAVLLDNMTVDELRTAVEMVDGRAVTEASGGITPETAPSIAATGVDLLSAGFLTHSAPNLDVGLDL